MTETFRGRRVSVIGAARSGVAAAEVLTRLGAEVLLSDSQSALKLGAARVSEIEATGAAFVPGACPADALPEGTELVVTSPGVPRTAEVLRLAVRRGIPVWSEIELAYRLTEVPIVATTGTNGKTTTTLLLAAMLQKAGFDAVVAGNISADAIKRTLVEAALPNPPAPFPTREGGEVSTNKGKSLPVSGGDLGVGQSLPASGRDLGVRQSDPDSEVEQDYGKSLPDTGRDLGLGQSRVLVAEISSFQLEWVERFAPKVAILTNITPDHLNRHSSFEEYAGAKARIFAAQTADDWALLNYDNPAARAVGESGLPGRRCWFTRRERPPDDGPAAWLHNGILTVRLQNGLTPTALLHVSDLPPTLPGAHSVENVLAAAAACLMLGADPDAIAEAVLEFRGVAHRMEFVADIGGVRFVNNSMCTNVAAAVSSLRALDRPGIVIAGGADKELDFAPLTPVLREQARHLVLIGSAAEKMERTFREGGYTAIARADSLEAAVTFAHALAAPGETVLLSPACASFDMFADFEARGAAFRRLVLTRKENTE